MASWGSFSLIPRDIIGMILDMMCYEDVFIMSLAFSATTTAVVSTWQFAPDHIMGWAAYEGYHSILLWYCNRGFIPDGVMERALRGGQVKIARWIKMKYRDDLLCSPKLLKYVVRKKDVAVLEFLVKRQNTEFTSFRAPSSSKAKLVLASKMGHPVDLEVMNVLPSAVEIACEENIPDVLGWALTMKCTPLGTYYSKSASLGNLEILKWGHHNGGKRFTAVLPSLYISAVCHRRRHILKWLLETFYVSGILKVPDNILRKMTKYDDVEGMKLVYDMYPRGFASVFNIEHIRAKHQKYPAGSVVGWIESSEFVVPV